jgi:hypothetical protein
MTRQLLLRVIPVIIGCSNCVVFGADVVSSPCEVLGSLDRFSGRTVTIRARLLVDVDLWLASPDFCPVALLVGKVKFQNLLALAWPDSPDVTYTKIKVPFATDQKSRDLWGDATHAAGRGNEEVVVVVEGLVVTRDPPMALVARRDDSERVGFGHLGMAPAMLIIKRVLKVEMSVRR